MAVTLVPCPSCGSGTGDLTPRLDAEQTLLCDVGPGGELLGLALVVYLYNNETGVAPVPSLVDPETGAPYVVLGTLQPCATGSGGGGTTEVLDSTVQRQVGAGNIVIAAGARSVTVTILTGDVTVDLGQGVTTLPAGNAFSWSADSAGGSLSDAFTFTGVAGSDFIVQSTRV